LSNFGGAITRLRAAYFSLLPSEKKIADFVLENVTESAQMSIDDLANSVGVSKASVLRLCKKTGYLGYRDFRYSLIQDTVQKHTDVLEELNISDSAFTILKKVTQANCFAINESLKITDPDILEKVSELIIEANKIELYATGGSAVVALDMYHKLLRLGYNCSFALDSRFQEMSSRLVKDNDLVIGFTFSGENKHVIGCLKSAGVRGAKRVCITNSINSPVTKVSDYVINASSAIESKVTGSLTPRIAQLNIIDSLFVLLVTRNMDISNYNLQQTLEVLDMERIKDESSQK